MNLLALALAIAAAAIWVVLLAGRGGFWAARETDEPAADGSDAPALEARVPDAQARNARAPDGLAPDTWPHVVAVIPARDEADMIEATVESLLRQDYPGAFEVVLVDDGSSDGTAEAARAAAARAGSPERLSVVSGRPLESGWTGKLFAMKQGVDQVGALAAPPEFVLFTDADIHHATDSLRSLVLRARTEKLVMVSLMARLRCASLAERALVPSFIFFFAMLYPFSWVNDPRRRTAAAAGGCVLVDRQALLAAGGVAAVRGELIDDCALGQLMKTRGPIRLLLTRRVESRRVYATFGAIRRMVVRSAYAQLRYSPLLLAGTIAGLAVSYLAAPMLAIGGHGTAQVIGILVWAAMTLALQPILAFYRVSPFWGVGLPLIAALYALFTLESAYLYYAGRGGQWKGRSQAAAGRGQTRIHVPPPVPPSQVPDGSVAFAGARPVPPPTVGADPSVSLPAPLHARGEREQTLRNHPT